MEPEEIADNVKLYRAADPFNNHGRTQTINALVELVGEMMREISFYGDDDDDIKDLLAKATPIAALKGQSCGKE